MIIRTNFARFMSGGNVAITLYPFVFITKFAAENEVIINHEKIHLVQQRELWVIGFYVLYLCYWVRGLIKGEDSAYLAIPFERESYSNESDMGYIANREPMAWRRY